jgi:ABC-type multidrug transport system fused ATPase/permease subunit
MSRVSRVDAAGLGRGPLTRWMPVLWQAPAEPPDLRAFELDERTTPRRFLLRVLFSAKRFTLPAAGCFVASQIGESLVPVVMGVAIDRALARGDVGELWIWLVVLALVFAVVTTGQRFSQQLVAVAAQRVGHRLRSTLSARVLHPSGQDSGRGPDGGVVSLMTNDVFRTAGLGLVVFPIGEVAAIVFIAVSLLVIHWPLGLFALVGAPLVVLLMGAMSGAYTCSSRAYQALLATTVGKATDLVSGYRVIKGVRAEAEATARYRQASQDALAGALRNAGRLGRYLAGSGAVSGVFVAAVASSAGWFALEGQMSIGGLIAAVGLAQALIPQMTMVTGNAVPVWAAANASAGRILDALRDAAPSPDQIQHQGPERPSAAQIGDAAATPTVEITVAGHDPIHLAPGELVAVSADDLTGARIATALLHPRAESDDVEVRLDRTPAGQVEHSAYRSQVVVAPHAVTLFSGTIADNLDLPAAPGRRRTPAKDASVSEASELQDVQLRQAALRAALCEDFAADARVVGESGVRLSGGQRQRVALARALAADAPVLVLHDPTTAVDSVTEALIAERLSELRRGRSTLLITSSPVLLGVCDRVVELRPPQGGRCSPEPTDAAAPVEVSAR